MSLLTGRRGVCCLLGALISGLAGAAQAGPSAAEMARIERLLAMIGSRRDMRLVRNGQEHDTDTAVSFLRGKLKHYGDDIKTAEDFIERLASRSSTTGQLYWVRLADGRQIPAGDFLRIELARLDKAAASR
ncbi:DUF5329 family protein [Aquincola sp. S2]|uniref:DUF5329 family protein n=1 Tax=Pseudaquabacterium terrae TaxID=2732868 RepID=A0ABX2ECZ1_9BURK|nr:DUF5329 family protein [Aquabacterium terrae]NRF66558.1 DUF5329 family protein [Aquabacterium terrae]